MKDSLGLHSVEDVARTLGVHVRTVRRYLREGRLRGTKIGKQYRITPADLAALTGQAAAQPAPDPVRLHRVCEASTIVQIDAISTEESMRIATGVGAAIKGRDRSSGIPLRVETVYDPVRARLKVIITGSLATTTGLMRMLASAADRTHAG